MNSYPSFLADLSLRQQILLTTDGTVTQLVKLFTGESIHVTKLEQEIIAAHEPALATEGAVSLLRRCILLSSEQRHYIHAQSVFVLDHLSDAMRNALLESDTPIGVIWQAERLESYREILMIRQEPREDLRVHFVGVTSDCFLSRTYRVYQGGRPFCMITESLPVSVFAD